MQSKKIKSKINEALLRKAQQQFIKLLKMPLLLVLLTLFLIPSTSNSVSTNASRILSAKTYAEQHIRQIGHDAVLHEFEHVAQHQESLLEEFSPFEIEEDDDTFHGKKQFLAGQDFLLSLFYHASNGHLTKQVARTAACNACCSATHTSPSTLCVFRI